MIFSLDAEAKSTTQFFMCRFDEIGDASLRPRIVGKVCLNPQRYCSPCFRRSFPKPVECNFCSQLRQTLEEPLIEWLVLYALSGDVNVKLRVDAIWKMS